MNTIFEWMPMTEQWFEEVQRCFQAHDWDGTQSALLRVMNEEPKNPLPRYHLANLFRLLKRPSEAVSILEPLEHEADVPAEYLWALFECRMEAGDYQAGTASIHLLPLDRDSSPQRLELALGCARLAGNYSLGLKIARRMHTKGLASELRWVLRVHRLLRVFPKFLRIKLARNFALHALQRCRWRRARVWLEAARAMYPQQFEWPFRLAHLQRISRDPFDPQFHWEFAWLSIALTIQPDRKEALRMRALTLFDMEPGQVVLDEIQQCPGAFSESERLRMQAACHANLQQYEKAAAAYHELHQCGDKAFAQFGLGLIHLEKSEYSFALKCFETAEEELETDDGFQFTLWFFYQACLQFENGIPPESICGQAIIHELDDSHEVANTFDEWDDFECPLCGNAAAGELLWKDHSTNWQRARCSSCGMIAVSPMPTEAQINAIYTRESRSEDSVNRGYRRQLMEALHASEDQLKTLNAYREATGWDGQFDWDAYEASLGETKRCLDVGCASGRTAATFQRLGWDAHGIDVDPQAIAVAQEHGLEVSVAHLEQLELDKLFDFITLVDVIEHVRDPKALMQRASQLLKPGGAVYIKTPCADSLPHRLVGERWLESAEHVQFFSQRTLTKLVEEAGFKIAASSYYVDDATPLLHYDQWQSRRFPQLFQQWTDRLQAGDAVRMLLLKPQP
ncbi:MAG: class I SAM-dependent methyltransferase [Candidatus Hinthialibacter antarcticus]|nr:class I SAM-dependent methyltransferase [Candidatus Hinthialibacter antarcticus]